MSIVMPMFPRRSLSNQVASALLILFLLAGARGVRGDDFGIDLPTVRSIVILGNRSFDDRVLKKRMHLKEARFYHLFRKPVYRRDFLNRDIAALRSFYSRNGFFSAEVRIESVVKDEKSNSVSIRIFINEGEQTVISRLEFSDQDLIGKEKLRAGLRLFEGEPYNPNLLEVDRYKLYSKFFEKGYLGARISFKTRIDSTSVDLFWEIEPGEPVRVDSVLINGATKVKEKLVRRELTIEKGEYFNLAEILESKQNLYDTGYFNSVEIEPVKLDVSGGEVDLNLQVRERKMGYIETGLGVGNIYANHVFCEWGQRNLLGRGYKLDVRTEYAFSVFSDNDYSLSKMKMRNKYIRHEGELSFPHVLSTWNTFTISAFYERDAILEPAIVRDISVSGSISRRFSRQTSLLAGYIYEQIRRQGIPDEKDESKRRSIDCTFRRDTRDFYFNPGKGNYTSIEGRYAGGVLGGEDDYYSVVTSLQDYDQISGRTVLAYRVRGGYAREFGKSKESGLPIESRFFAGGGNSVRGYDENTLGPVRSNGEAIGGRVLLLTNVELRFPLAFLARYNFGGAFFLDGGNVWNDLKDIKLKEFRLFSERDDVTYLDYRYGAGFGIRYYTPVGPIRVDMGFPLTKTPEIDYNYWIHISLGQIF